MLKKFDLFDINKIENVYLDAFSKKERKSFSSIKKELKKNKIVIYTLNNNDNVLGFISLIPYKNLVMVDYLAINHNFRGLGSGSKNIKEIYKEKTIVLSIEKEDDLALNKEQRIKRKSFYLKTGLNHLIYS